MGFFNIGIPPIQHLHFLIITNAEGGLNEGLTEVEKSGPLLKRELLFRSD